MRSEHRHCRQPHIEAERVRIRDVLVIGSTGGAAIWIAVGELAGMTGVIALLAICLLVAAAAAQAVDA